MTSSPTALRKKDLLSAYLRCYVLQAAWNFERGLNYGVAFVLLPVLRRLYPKEEQPEALVRHLEYFNTQPYLASFILGALARLEEEKQSEPRASRGRMRQREEEISALKVGMMGPVAALGDNLFWATLRPYCVVLAVCTAYSGALGPGRAVWAVPLLFLVVYNAAHLMLRTVGFRQGYRHGDQVVLNLRRYGFQEAVSGLRVAASVLLGVLVVLVNQADVAKGPALFLTKMGFFGAILMLYVFALQRKIRVEHMFYAVVLFALVLAYWPELSAPPPAGSAEGTAGGGLSILPGAVEGSP